MPIVPYILTGADVAERIYKLIQNIQANRQRSRNEDVAKLQDDVAKLRDAVELQTRLMEQREKEIVELRGQLETLRTARKPFWRRAA